MIRDQAAAALLFVSGMRASALVTLPISALDLENLTVRQWPELGVHTKNGKKATTFLLNIPDILTPIHRWDALVRLALPPTAPWYTPIEHNWGEQYLSSKAPGKTRIHALEKRLRLLFTQAQMEFKSPHKFRHGHAVFGLLHAQTMADYKAVSMNLMHDNIEITDSTYAPCCLQTSNSVLQVYLERPHPCRGMNSKPILATWARPTLEKPWSLSPAGLPSDRSSKDACYPLGWLCDAPAQHLPRQFGRNGAPYPATRARAAIAK